MIDSGKNNVNGEACGLVHSPFHSHFAKTCFGILLQFNLDT